MIVRSANCANRLQDFDCVRAITATYRRQTTFSLGLRVGRQGFLSGSAGPPGYLIAEEHGWVRQRRSNPLKA
jgi:hypothetical protein